MSLNRRRFLGSLAAAGFLCPRYAHASAFPVQFRKPSPFAALYPQIQPGRDEFAGEIEAVRVETELRRSQETGLGTIRRARYSVLPGGRVRYEIASEHDGNLEYRVGIRTGAKPGDERVIRSARPWFRDVTGQVFSGCASFQEQLSRGVPYWRARLDLATGIDIYGTNGISVGDIDGDGQDEVYVCQPGGLPDRLYKLVDGRFHDITEAAGLGVLDDTSCALFLDLRNLGRQDLVVLRGAGPLLFLNDGQGRFAVRPDAFQFAHAPQGSFTGMAAADYDRDGKVDLYLCTYSFFQSEDQYLYPAPYHDAQNGPPNFLFRNRLNADGGGLLEDVTNSVGLDENNNRFSFAPAWCDYDGDGWPDLCVANDFGRKNLYQNVRGRFRDVTAAAGVDDYGPGMSAAWFDYDGDGKPDLYVSNMWTAVGQRVTADKNFKPAADEALRKAYRGHTRGNSLYRNRGDGTFEYRGDKEGVEMGRWAWSADGIDFDNDGTHEIFVTCGMLTNSREEDLEGFFWRQVVAKSPVTAVPSAAYENGWNAINQFIREEYSWSGRQENVFYARRDGRYVDYSGVSGLDLAEDSRAFAVTDLDGDGNLDLLVKNRLGPQVRVFQNDCAEGRKAIAFLLHGVLSNRDAIGARVEVDGRVKFLQAGSGYLSQHTKRLHFGLGSSESAGVVRILWPSGSAQEHRDLPAGFLYIIEEGSPRVEKRPFAARKTQAGGAPVEALNAPALADTWLLDPVPLPDMRKGPGLLCIVDGAAVPPADLPHEVVDARKVSGDVMAAYALFRRYLFDWRADLTLPLLLLIDERGRARKIYASMPDAKRLRGDLEALSESEAWRLALPFRGEYHARPHRNTFKLGAAFYWAGYPEQALGYFEETVRRSPENAVALMAVGQIHLEAARFDAARDYSERALKVNPKLAGAWNCLGGVEMGQGRLAAALEHYQRAIALQPDMKAAIVNAGQVQERLGRSREAEVLFRKALELDPTDSDVADRVGLLLAKGSQYDEAKRWFQRAIELRKDNASAINNLGVLYMQTGQTNDAIAAFDYGIRVAPDNEMLYVNLAKTYVKSGDRARAKEVLERLLERKPGNQTALRGIAELQ